MVPALAWSATHDRSIPCQKQAIVAQTHSLAPFNESTIYLNASLNSFDKGSNTLRQVEFLGRDALTFTRRPNLSEIGVFLDTAIKS